MKKTMLLVLLISISLYADILSFEYYPKNSSEKVIAKTIVNFDAMQDCKTYSGFNGNVIDNPQFKNFEYISDEKMTVKYATCRDNDMIKIKADVTVKYNQIKDFTSYNLFIKKGQTAIGKIENNTRTVFALVRE